MSVKITESVTWVGKIDWALRTFHGEELSTHRGSSYNAFLVRDEKTVLIDTVWGPFAQEFVDGLKKEIDLNEIDYIIANHGETDHSGALPLLMKEIPNVPIYCSANGVKSLKGQYHQDWNFVTVKTGDELDLGKKKIKFIEAKMLHWPDTIFSYLTEENILFSSDAFGQHLATEMFYDDLVDQAELWYEVEKYYANILNPFNPMIEKKIEEILAMNLPLNLICPDHGVIWRKQIDKVVGQYLQWSKGYQEHQATIVYDTMWQGTQHLATAIADGLRAADSTLVIKVHPIGKGDKNDALTDIFRSELVIVGSPTVNNGILSNVAAILSQIKELHFKNKKAAAFGTYGWSGESVKIINEELTKAGLEVVHDGYRTMWNPDTESLAAAKQMGMDLANKLK